GVRARGGARRGGAAGTATGAWPAGQSPLSPASGHAPSPRGRAVVVAPDRSDPPVDSVIHWPLVIATSGSVEVNRGSQASRIEASTSGWHSRAAAPSDIATGQEKVADSGPYTCSSAWWTTRVAEPHCARAPLW